MTSIVHRPSSAATGVAGRVTWRVADVTDVSTVDPDEELTGTVALVLDNGCLHGLGAAQRPG